VCDPSGTAVLHQTLSDWRLEHGRLSLKRDQSCDTPTLSLSRKVISLTDRGPIEDLSEFFSGVMPIFAYIKNPRVRSGVW
jgi:hypothetical protein